jgi:signal peptidase II
VAGGRRRRPGTAATEERVLTEPTEERALRGPTGTPEPPAGARPGPRATARPCTRLLLGLAGVVLLLDLVTKVVVVALIEPGEDIRVLGGLLYLTQLRNLGAAFSFAEGATIVFSVIAIVVAAVILRTARKVFSSGWAVALGLVLGGAVGNLVDRVFRDPGFLRGGVVDFLSVFAPDGRVWPVFNVADSAIVCGAVLGALLALRGVEFDGTRAPARPRARRDEGAG